MRYSLLLAVVLLFSLVIGQCYAVEDKPKLICDEITYNFGEVVNTKTVKHTFILRNEGDAPLAISRVSTGCGCTTADISAKNIAPGEKATLNASFSLHRRKGEQKINIRVMSNDPEQPVLTLSLEGTAVAEIEVKPSNIYFKDIAENTSVVKIVDIVTGTDKPFKITKVESNSHDYYVELDKVEEGESYRFNVYLKPQLSQKHISGEIFVFTDNPNYEKISIRVLANIVGLFTIRPEEIALVPDVDFAMTRYIVIRSAENKPFTIKSVTVPIPSIKTEVIPMDENGYRIRLSNIKPTKEIDGKNLIITTNLAERKEILIPFRVISGESESFKVEQRKHEYKLIPEVTALKEEKIAPDNKLSTKETIIKEGRTLVRAIRTAQRLYFAENTPNRYTDKWEDISGSINIAGNKYFTTPPTITVAGEGKSAAFTVTVVGSGEAEGVSVSIDKSGNITITGLK